MNTKIALGYSQGSLISYDYFKEDSCFMKSIHRDRVSCIEWYGNTIYTGSRDRTVKGVDTRANHETIIFPQDHYQELCGVKAYSNYLASGGNDNSVYIYDIRKNSQYLSHY